MGRGPGVRQQRIISELASQRTKRLPGTSSSAASRRRSRRGRSTGPSAACGDGASSTTSAAARAIGSNSRCSATTNFWNNGGSLSGCSRPSPAPVACPSLRSQGWSLSPENSGLLAAGSPMWALRPLPAF
jgi:hypothetical protein